MAISSAPSYLYHSPSCPLRPKVPTRSDSRTFRSVRGFTSDPAERAERRSFEGRFSLRNHQKQSKVPSIVHYSLGSFVHYNLFWSKVLEYFIYLEKLPSLLTKRRVQRRLDAKPMWSLKASRSSAPYASVHQWPSDTSSIFIVSSLPCSKAEKNDSKSAWKNCGRSTLRLSRMMVCNHTTSMFTNNHLCFRRSIPLFRLQVAGNTGLPPMLSGWHPQVPPA